MKLRTTLLGLALAASATYGTAAEARELRFASGYPPGSIPTQALEKFKASLEEETNGELGVRIFELSLLNLMETSAGIRDGMADMGVLLTPYFPAQYPHTNMVAEISMLLELGESSPDQAGLIYTGAMAEFIFTKCPECIEEFAAQNQVFLGGAATPPYSLLCRSEVTSIADLEGKRLRTSGAQWARWAESMGAVPITMSVNEIYEGLSQGVVDCSVQSTSELSVFRLFEVVDAITLNHPGGVFSGVGAGNINSDTWRSLEDSERQALLKSMSVLSAFFTWGYETAAVENQETAREQGIAIVEPNDALRQATREFIETDLKGIAQSYAQTYDIENPEAMIESFREVLDRWRGLIDNVESGEELAEIYWQEVFSKVDAAAYAQ